MTASSPTRPKQAETFSFPEVIEIIQEKYQTDAIIGPK